MKRRTVKNKGSKDHIFRSNSEYNCSKYLLENNVAYEYEPYPIHYEWTESKKYIPDFVLPNGIILEVKGRFLLEDRKKHLFIRKQRPELDIRIVFDNPKRKLYKGGKMTYEGWCNKHNFKFCRLSDGIPTEWLNEKCR